MMLLDPSNRNHAERLRERRRELTNQSTKHDKIKVYIMNEKAVMGMIIKKIGDENQNPNA